MYQPNDTLRESLDFCSEFSFSARLGWWSFESWRDPAVHYAATLRLLACGGFAQLSSAFAALTSASSRLINSTFGCDPPTFVRNRVRNSGHEVSTLITHCDLSLRLGPQHVRSRMCWDPVGFCSLHYLPHGFNIFMFLTPSFSYLHSCCFIHFVILEELTISHDVIVAQHVR